MKLTMNRTAYTKFNPALDQITKPRPGDVNKFLKALQKKVDQKLENPPTTDTLKVKLF